jgi:NNP family nitrate/nitrite transporter-like MFS transporter
MFPNSSGAVAGIVGGVGTVGGIVFPLVYAAPYLSSLHVGYAIVAAFMVPIVLLNAWVYRPHVARRATIDGLLDVGSSGSNPKAPTDD